MHKHRSSIDFRLHVPRFSFLLFLSLLFRVHWVNMLVFLCFYLWKWRCFIWFNVIVFFAFVLLGFHLMPRLDPYVLYWFTASIIFNVSSGYTDTSTHLHTISSFCYYSCIYKTTTGKGVSKIAAYGNGHRIY